MIECCITCNTELNDDNSIYKATDCDICKKYTCRECYITSYWINNSKHINECENCEYFLCKCMKKYMCRLLKSSFDPLQRCNTYNRKKYPKLIFLETLQQEIQGKINLVLAELAVAFENKSLHQANILSEHLSYYLKLQERLENELTSLLD